MASIIKSTACTEYQHFIPQFLLRNYAYPFVCPKIGCSQKKKSKCKHEKGKHPSDPVINCIDLTKTPLQVEVLPVNRVFGAPGMYHDSSGATTKEQRRIESKLGLMESQASTIFRLIVKAHEAGEEAVTLTRVELDLIKKFLFLLKYRGSSAHKKFYHETAEEYSSNDRDILLDYMGERGISSPKDVWFNNLEAVMNLEMDPEGNWRKELLKRMFPLDAMWFIMHIASYYMAICTPDVDSGEFILTSNSHNVFEGPNTFMKDAVTGKVAPSGNGSFHEFAPISPQLMIVLRSLVLPNQEEDHDPKVMQMRQEEYWSSFGQLRGANCKSLLEDLPVHKARNTYSQVVNGVVLPNPGYDGKCRSTDRFFYSFHAISAKQVQIINNTFLENSYNTGTLAFRDQNAFSSTLNSYIGGPCTSFKILRVDDSVYHFRHLLKLEALARTMGFQGDLEWRPGSSPRVVISERFSEKILAFLRMLNPVLTGQTQLIPNQPITFWELYAQFGELELDYRSDIAQAGKMVQFQTIVETWSQGLNDTVQQQNQYFIDSMFKAFRCSKYWLYLKLLRKESLGLTDGAPDIVDILIIDDVRQGPEDVFAKTCVLYNRDVLNEMMHVTVCNDIFRRKFALTYSQDVVSQALLYYYTFNGGEIRHCGITNIERFAEKVENRLRQKGTQCYPVELPHLENDEQLELQTRMLVRLKFLAIMAGKATSDVLNELEDVLFGITFPTPPFKSQTRGHFS